MKEVKMNENSFAEIREFISKVVREGSGYQIEAMERLYTSDQSLLFLNSDGGVARVSRAQMIAEFAARRNSGEPHLSTEYRILHIEQQGDTAVALLYRRMSRQTAPFLYELRLRREGGSWMVSGETVTPWPDPATAGAFLPPRENLNG
jgi:hypothetical protein